MNRYGYAAIFAIGSSLAACSEDHGTPDPTPLGPVLTEVQTTDGNIRPLRKGMSASEVFDLLGDPQTDATVTTQFHADVPLTCYLWDVGSQDAPRFIHIILDGNTLARTRESGPVPCPPFS